MSPTHHKQARVECESCQFTPSIDEDDDRLLADVVREHGRETEQKLSVQFPHG